MAVRPTQLLEARAHRGRDLERREAGGCPRHDPRWNDLRLAAASEAAASCPRSREPSPSVRLPIGRLHERAKDPEDGQEDPEEEQPPVLDSKCLRRLTVLIHVFDMRGSALAGPAPRPLHDFESSARRTGQVPSVVVRRERDRHVVLGPDPVAQLRHVHRVPQIHNVETSVETL